MILRHSAIVGSTGSGKSNTTVTILKAILNDYKGSRIILVDPHGEYASAFPDAKVLKINDQKNPLYIPFWLMNFNELTYFLVGATPKDDTRPEFRQLRELIVNYKRDNHDKLKVGPVNINLITADSPIPFNIRKVWWEMNWWLNATFSESSKDNQTKDKALLEKDDDGNDKIGDYNNLRSAEFQPYSMGSQQPYKSKHQDFYSYEKKILTRLKDSRYDFMFNPGDYKDENSPKDLHDLLNEWIGNEQRLTILDLSGVPFDILDITIGLITRFIFDSMFWGRLEKYTGKNRPLLIAYEEAHTYLNRNENNSYSKKAVEIGRAHV